MRVLYAKIENGGLHSESDRLPVEQLLGEDADGSDAQFFVKVGNFKFPVVTNVVQVSANGNKIELFVDRCDVGWHNGIAYNLIESRHSGSNRVLFLLDWSCPTGDWSEGLTTRQLELKFDEFEPGMYVDSHDEQLMLELREGDHIGFTRQWLRKQSTVGSAVQWAPLEQRCALGFDGENVVLFMETVNEVGGCAKEIAGSTKDFPVAGAGKRVRSGQDGEGSQSKALVHVPNINASKGVTAVTFDDVIGQDKAKKVLREFVGYLQGFDELHRLHTDMPRGVLLFGDGGNGKTLLAKAMSNEAGVPFIEHDPALLISPYAGESAQKIQKLFEALRAEAKKNQSPVILFMDEIDVIGQQRPKGAVSGSEQNRIEALNALLKEMDGFVEHEFPVIIMGTTNREESLDESLLRDGRFDRKITLGNPKKHELVQLLELYSRKHTLAADVDLVTVARKLAGLPASSAKRVCNESALKLYTARKAGQKVDGITQEMYMEAAMEAVSEHIGKSKGQRFVVSDDSIKLPDVIGQESAKLDVQDIIDYLRDPHSFKEIGAAIPRGMVFSGGPGLGKTRLARALAGEADVPFFSISGSDFVEKYVGVGAQRVRALFAEARRNAPCIVFIDEIDAVGKRRSETGEGGSQERDQTLNQILVELDGFQAQDDPIVVIAATNLVSTLDPALVRPGRLDREAKFQVPDVEARIELFEYYTRGKKLAKGVNLEFFARNTFGFSAAGIEQVCNEAVLLSRREGSKEVTSQHMDAAITRVTIGAPLKLGNVTQEDLENTAVHEGGHAVVGYLGGGRKIARITVMPAGGSLGHVAYMNDDRHSSTKKDMLARIASALAGRAATELVLDCVDTGPSSDFESAYSVAYKMVTEYGMSNLGIIPAMKGVERSEAQKQRIEDEVARILNEQYQVATQLIEQHRAAFDKLVQAVLRKETILGPEFEAILAGKRVRATRSKSKVSA